MKFCATQPAWFSCTPSFSIVSLTVSRNAFASAAVGAGGVDDPAAQPMTRTAVAAAASAATEERCGVIMCLSYAGAEWLKARTLSCEKLRQVPVGIDQARVARGLITVAAQLEEPVVPRNIRLERAYDAGAKSSKVQLPRQSSSRQEPHVLQAANGEGLAHRVEHPAGQRFVSAGEDFGNLKRTLRHSCSRPRISSEPGEG